MTRSDIIWLCTLAVPIGLILLVKLLVFVKEFLDELRYINSEIARTCGEERHRWIRRKRLLWRALLPFGRK